MIRSLRVNYIMTNIWYTVDEPRDIPCWQCNPNLWFIFNKLREQRGLSQLSNLDYFTEQYVVQTIDLEFSKENYDHVT
jgi:hypothetical protein